MTLQKQVCTFEQAKMLKELGCEQGKSCFVWAHDENIYEKVAVKEAGDAHFSGSIIADAYTVAELGEMLIQYNRMQLPYYDSVECFSEPDDDCWVVKYPPDYKNGTSFTTEAQARAALLIHILENKQ